MITSGVLEGGPGWAYAAADVLDAAHYWLPLSTVRRDFEALGEEVVWALVPTRDA